ncbi:SDR family oxidoreductase [Massilia sp. W12]|uniref:SDR family NAD(P)-dependent oxidoreductase n=1 Tax=Massilia sp. W12 TaxID=3126507 RepID=UPI0030CAA43C
MKKNPGRSKRHIQPACLITGASGGIGLALAHQAAAAGRNLALVARSEARLQEIAAELHSRYGVQTWVVALDLAQPGAPQQLARALERLGVEVEILLNNAGVLEQGAFIEISPERHQQIIDLNISALTAMLGVFLPGMLARKTGKIMNVASIAAFQPVVGLACYAASKAYVLSLSEALAEECRGSGVTVTALCPGITDTGMMQYAQGKNQQLRIPAAVIADPDTVARQAWAALEAGQAVITPGLLNQAAVLASRATPKWLVRRISGLLGRSAI